MHLQLKRIEELVLERKQDIEAERDIQKDLLEALNVVKAQR